VAVDHGKVRVRSPSGEAYVQAGEARWFDLNAESAHAPAVPATTTKREASRKGTASVPKPQARLEWRSLNQAGDYERAYRLLEEGAPVGEDVEALMEAADVARLSGHPEVAVRYLEKIVRKHRANPATPLAAFTLGRMLLSQLARPSEAAEAFAAARELAPNGSLSQDALAREVEAWSKAGQTKQAYLRAQLFVEKYPNSKRRRLVEQYGGLDSP
jgi:transmembrane sensor